MEVAFVRRLAYLATLLAALSIAAPAADLRDAPKAEEDPREEVKRDVYAAIATEDEGGFARLGPPQSGDWLAIHKEPPQPLQLYKALPCVRPAPQRKTIVLQPLGKLSAEQQQALETLRAYSAAFFQLPARIAAPLELTVPGLKLDRPVPIGNRHDNYERQYDADQILEHLLLKKLPDDAVVYLGITMEDLYSGNLNYVFGLGSLKERVGVYSLCRYYPEFWGRARAEGDDTLALRRACKVLNHETGHLFGLTHCVFYRCGMNGSNSLSETDGAPVEYCPVCHRKLAWNIGFDPVRRFEELVAFYSKHQLADDAALLQKRLKNWKLLAAREKIRQGGEE